MKWVLLLAGLCSSCAGSLPSPEDVARQSLESLLLGASFALSDSDDTQPEVQAAYNAVGALLSAWNHADQERFDAAIPCALEALREAEAVVGQSRVHYLQAARVALETLSDGTFCRRSGSTLGAWRPWLPPEPWRRALPTWALA